MKLLHRVSRWFLSPHREPSRRHRSRSPVRLWLEPLETRLAPATTTVAGLSIGQTLTAVVNGQADVGLSVVSTSGFNDGYLLIGPAATPTALVSYHAITGNSFTHLAMPAGNGSQVLSDSTAVNQAAMSTTTNTEVIPVSSSTITVSGTGTFATAGFLYVLARSGPNNIQYTGTTVASGKTSFTGCTVVSGSTHATIPPGTTVIASVAPTPPTTGQTTTTNLTNMPVNSITIPVASTNGFTQPTPGSPGYLLIHAQQGDNVVKYTGMTTISFTGCMVVQGTTTNTMNNGTIVVASASKPVTFTFTNSTNLQLPVYVAMAGQDPLGTYGYFRPRDPTMPLSGQTVTFVPFTSTMAGTNVPNYRLFAASAPANATATIKFPNKPLSRIDSARVVFSVGVRSTIPILSNLQPSFPAPSNPNDPDNPINYDFLEFTERSAPNDGALFINTTQVDAVGMPFTMNVTPGDTVKTNGVGITIPRQNVSSLYGTYARTQLAAVPALYASPFQALATPYRLLAPSDFIAQHSGAEIALPLTAYFNPAIDAFFKKYHPTSPGYAGPLMLTTDGITFSGTTVTGFTPPAFTYSAVKSSDGRTLTIPAIPQPVGTVPAPMSDGLIVSGIGVVAGTTTTGVITVDQNNITKVPLSTALTPSAQSRQNYTFTIPGQYTVMEFTGSGQTYHVYAPFFSSNGGYPVDFPNSTSGLAPAPPPWIAATEYPGQMVFGCDGVFGDGTAQDLANQIHAGSGTTLKDIENLIVSALNRGVANQAVDTWVDSTQYYPLANTAGDNWANYYAGFLHNGKNAGQPISVTTPGSSVGLAYGFAYDDQGGNDPLLVSILPQTVAITLGPWSSSTLQFTTQPLSTSRQPVSFTVTSSSTVIQTLSVQLLMLTTNGFATAVDSPFTITTNSLGVATGFKTVGNAGTYVLEVMSQTGGQYSVSNQFTITLPTKTLKLSRSTLSFG